MAINDDKSANIGNNLEIFDKIKEEVVVFEIIHDILDNIADLRVIYVNDAFLTERNATLEEIKGITITELYGVDIAEYYLKIAAETLISGEGKKYEAYFKSSDKYYSVSAYSPDNEIYIVISSDVTDSKKTLNKSKNIIENIDEVYFELNNKWQFINANSKIGSFTGLKKNELIGKNIWEEFSELKNTEYYTKFHEAKSQTIDVHFNIKSPKTREWYRIHAYPYPDGLEVYLKNINKEIIAEKELGEIETKFKTLFEENNDAVIISDIKTGKYINVNRKAEELTGYSKKELLSMGTGEISSNDLKEMAIEELRKLSNEGNIKIETQIQTKDKGLVPIEVCTSIIETDDNIYSFSILKDISIIKKADEEKEELYENIKQHIEELKILKEKLDSASEELYNTNKKLRINEEEILNLKQKLQENESQYRSLAENLPSVLMRYDRNLRMIYIAPSAEHISDVSIDDFIGKTNREVGIPEEICNLWEPAIEKVFQTGKTQELQFEFPSVNNDFPKSFHLKFVPEFTADGSDVQYVLGMSTDITKGKKAEIENQELRKQVQQFAEELKSSNEELKMANKEISKGKEILTEINNALQESEKESLQLLVEIEAIYNSAPIGLCTLDRELRYMRVNKKLAEINGVDAEDHIGKKIHEIVPDIAEQAEDIARFIFKNGLPVRDVEFSSINSNGLLRSCTEQWVPLKDIDGNIVGINVSVLETSELKNIEGKLKEAEENLEEEIKEKIKYENDYNTLLKSYSIINGIIECSDDLIAAWNNDYEFIALNKAYKEVFRKIFGRNAKLGMNIKDLLLDSPENHLEALHLWEKALKGEKCTVEMAFDIESHNVFYETTFYPLKNKQGDLIGASHIARNITEHLKSEEKLKKQVEDLKISNEELQKLTNVAPLDLDESFEDIERFIQLLEEQYKDKSDEDADELINKLMETSISRVGDLNEDSPFLDKVDEFNSIYTNSMVDHVIDTFKESIDGYNGEITHDTLPNIKGDAGQLQSVFQNLISNAIKFRKPDEPPKIHITAKEDKQNNEYIFQITDNGIGLKKEYMGIESSTKKAIEWHGGRIWVESTPGNGSTFYFTLPINYSTI